MEAAKYVVTETKRLVATAFSFKIFQEHFFFWGGLPLNRLGATEKKSCEEGLC